MKINRTEKRYIMAAVLCILLSVVLIAEGRIWDREGKNYLQNLTIQSYEGGFPADWLQSALAREGEQEETEDPATKKNTFAAWHEWKGEMISEHSSGRNSSGDVITIYGSSHCLIPLGKNLTPSDEKGCLIGSKLAEKLFGSFSAEGQKIRWRDSTWTVRSVIQKPASLLIVQAGGFPNWTEKLPLDRISLTLEDGQDRRLTGEHFVNQNNLSAQTLRWDNLHGYSWLLEIIPGKWSDFDGWRQNLQTQREVTRFTEHAAKSSVDAWGLECQSKGRYFTMFGILLLITGSKLFHQSRQKYKNRQER